MKIYIPTYLAPAPALANEAPPTGKGPGETSCLKTFPVLALHIISCPVLVPVTTSWLSRIAEHSATASREMIFGSVCE